MCLNSAVVEKTKRSAREFWEGWKTNVEQLIKRALLGDHEAAKL